MKGEGPGSDLFAINQYKSSIINSEVNPIVSHFQMGLLFLGIAPHVQSDDSSIRHVDSSPPGGDGATKTKKTPLKKNEGIKVPWAM